MATSAVDTRRMVLASVIDGVGEFTEPNGDSTEYPFTRRPTLRRVLHAVPFTPEGGV